MKTLLMLTLAISLAGCIRQPPQGPLPRPGNTHTDMMWHFRDRCYLQSKHLIGYARYERFKCYGNGIYYVTMRNSEITMVSEYNR